MGASFRNKDEILELAGCDLLTISPTLLEELKESSGSVPRKLDADKAHQLPLQKMHIDEKAFRYLVNDDPMATEKLSEGVRNFVKDIVKLEKLIQEKI